MPILPYLVTPWGEGDQSWHGKQLHQATATSTGIFGLPPLRIATDNAHGRNVGPWNAQSMVGGFGWTERLLSVAQQQNRAVRHSMTSLVKWKSPRQRSTSTSWRTSGCKFTQALRGSEARSLFPLLNVSGLIRDRAYYLDPFLQLSDGRADDVLYSVYRSVVRQESRKKWKSRWRRARINALMIMSAYRTPSGTSHLCYLSSTNDGGVTCQIAR
jgi:hypothetical protein